MPQGTVKWYDPDKGFGFVARDDGGSDLFLHHTMVGSETLAEGDRISFAIGFGMKGERAEDIRVIERSGNPPRTRRPQGQGQGYGDGGGSYAPRGGGGGYGTGIGNGYGERRPTVDPATLPRLEGTVRRFDPERGFGFISTPDASEDVFFHGSAVIGSPVDRGDTVEFRLGQSARGPRAMQVRALRDAR
jgi:CspA family cold shock protein